MLWKPAGRSYWTGRCGRDCHWPPNIHSSFSLIETESLLMGHMVAPQKTRSWTWPGDQVLAHRMEVEVLRTLPGPALEGSAVPPPAFPASGMFGGASSSTAGEGDALGEMEEKGEGAGPLCVAGPRVSRGFYIRGKFYPVSAAVHSDLC